MLRPAIHLLAPFLLASSVMAHGPAAEPTTEPVVEAPRADLQYLSDFFCFAGGDDAGRVVFAFDANRGRRDTAEQAEFFAVLWVEGRGWVELDGTGDLEGDEVTFRTIPSTAAFRVEGTPELGLTVTSGSNDLALTVEALDAITRSSDGDARFASGAAAATVTLGERRLAGRVTWEHSFLPDKNPLVKTYTDLFGDGYHGVYAFVGEPASAGDLRFHRSGGSLEPLVGRFNGFVTGPGPTLLATDAKFKISNKSLGGFFRWPGRYRANWSVPDETGRAARAVSFDLRLRDRETLVNYVFGGVAVAIAEGTVTRDGVPEPAFGLALIVR